MKENPRLNEEYRSAWENYDLSLRELQAAADKGGGAHLDMLLLSVEKARLEYSAARDRLAADMLGADIQALATATANKRVRDTAQLLWDLSGMPQGSAENDWLRAERIVQYAGGR